MTDLDKILSNEMRSPEIKSTVTIFGMIRASENPDEFELALGDTDQWIRIPRILVESAAPLETKTHGEKKLPFTKLVIQRPDTQAFWFDLLSFVMLRGAELVRSTQGQCNCSRPEAGSSSARWMGSTASCFACWIASGGQGEYVCWRAGYC